MIPETTLTYPPMTLNQKNRDRTMYGLVISWLFTASVLDFTFDEALPGGCAAWIEADKLDASAPKTVYKTLICAAAVAVAIGQAAVCWETADELLLEYPFNQRRLAGYNRLEIISDLEEERESNGSHSIQEEGIQTRNNVNWLQRFSMFPIGSLYILDVLASFSFWQDIGLMDSKKHKVLPSFVFLFYLLICSSKIVKGLRYFKNWTEYGKTLQEIKEHLSSWHDTQHRVVNSLLLAGIIGQLLGNEQILSFLFSDYIPHSLSSVAIGLGAVGSMGFTGIAMMPFFWKPLLKSYDILSQNHDFAHITALLLTTTAMLFCVVLSSFDLSDPPKDLHLSPSFLSNPIAYWLLASLFQILPSGMIYPDLCQVVDKSVQGMASFRQWSSLTCSQLVAVLQQQLEQLAARIFLPQSVAVLRLDHPIHDSADHPADQLLGANRQEGEEAKDEIHPSDRIPGK